MKELHRAADKLRRELDIVEQMGPYTDDVDDPVQLQLLVQQTKRVRSASNFLVRVAAQRRDKLQP